MHFGQVVLPKLKLPLKLQPLLVLMLVLLVEQPAILEPPLITVALPIITQVLLRAVIIFLPLLKHITMVETSSIVMELITRVMHP